jgi:Rhodopirellula transposase DDE domain
MSLLVWTTKSTRNLADALTRLGHRVSDRTVARMLTDLGFSLQGNTKVLEGSQHADRDAQFRYLHEQVTEYAAAGQPVISSSRSTQKRNCDTRSHVASELARQEGRLSVGGVVPGQCSMARARSEP